MPNCGNILNPKLAKSQYIGAVMMGIGMARMEGNELESRNGLWMNAELAIGHFALLAMFLNGRRVPLETSDKIGSSTSPLDQRL